VELGSVTNRLTSILLMACVLAAGVMLVPALFGYQRYVVTGGSMAGSLDRGSLAFDRQVPTSDLKVGDVITYTPPFSSGAHHGLTHRIVWIGRGVDGRRTYRTKGDANAAPDAWTFELAKRTQARLAFHIPYLGYVFSALALRWVRLLVIGLPALLIAISVLRGLWRDATEEIQQPTGAVA
jgi:signal peptidase